MLIKFAMW